MTPEPATHTNPLFGQPSGNQTEQSTLFLTRQVTAAQQNIATPGTASELILQDKEEYQPIDGNV